MTDEAIVRLFYERSEQAIAALAEKHGSAAAAVARSILGSEQDAEECVNDTYLGVWNTVPPQNPSPLRTFVCKIARNLATAKYHANTAKKRGSRYVGRSEYEAPETDGSIFFGSEEPCEIGSFVNVKITAAKAYDLMGERV